MNFHFCFLSDYLEPYFSFHFPLSSVSTFKQLHTVQYLFCLRFLLLSLRRFVHYFIWRRLLVGHNVPLHGNSGYSDAS